jgi:hypothetical protein
LSHAEDAGRTESRQFSGPVNTGASISGPMTVASAPGEAMVNAPRALTGIE